MRRILFLSLLFPLSALAQYPVYPAQPQQQQTPDGLYPYKKAPPPGAVYEPGNQGIPTSGTQQMNQLPNANNRNRGTGGPTIIHQGKGRGSPTYIIGPDGTRVCTDASGRTVVCW